MANTARWVDDAVKRMNTKPNKQKPGWCLYVLTSRVSNKHMVQFYSRVLLISCGLNIDETRFVEGQWKQILRPVLCLTT